MLDQQLEVFVTVAETRNFTRAAAKLHLSQPAISQQVHAFEKRFGVKLLDRTNKFVRLTEAGAVAYHHAKEILGLYGQMERLIQDLNEEATGALRIGASFTFGEYVLPHVIARFQQTYPRITPTISIENTKNVIRKVADGALDIGIIEGMSISEGGIDVEPFADDTVAVIASNRHPLAGLKSVSAEALCKEHWIVREEGSGTREITDYILKTYGVQPRTMEEYSSTQVIKELVEAGLGISVLSAWAIRKEIRLKTLREIPLTGKPIRRKFSVALRKSDFHTKATRLFQQFLHSRLDEAWAALKPRQR